MKGECSVLLEKNSARFFAFFLVLWVCRWAKKWKNPNQVIRAILFRNERDDEWERQLQERRDSRRLARHDCWDIAWLLSICEACAERAGTPLPPGRRYVRSLSYECWWVRWGCKEKKRGALVSIFGWVWPSGVRKIKVQVVIKVTDDEIRTYRRKETQLHKWRSSMIKGKRTTVIDCLWSCG